MTELEITVEGTPNPNAAKFVLSRPLLGDSRRSYFDPEAARDDPLASRLFEIEGVRALLMLEDFITVTKTDGAEWDDIVDRVERVIHSELA